MPPYDCMLLFKPHIRKESLIDLVTRVGKHVSRRNGVVTDLKSFGHVHLGYGIKKLDGRFYQACLIPAPKGTSCFNYARCVNKILRGPKNMKVDSWELWNSFRLLCEHHSSLLIALDISSPLPSDNSLERWFGEPVITAIIHTDEFSTKDRDNSKFLSRSMEKLVTDFLNHSMQVMQPSNQVHPEAIGDPLLNAHSAAGSQKHRLRPYLYYVGSLYKRLDPLPELERLDQIAYFTEPSHDCLVECLPTCISDSNPPKFPPLMPGLPEPALQ